PCMGDFDYLADRRHRAQHVTHMGNRNDTCALAQRRRKSIDVEAAIVAHIDPSDHCALALAVKMPGHDIGVMLHDRGDDFIALPDAWPGEGLRDEVDGLSGRAGEDDLLAAPGIEKSTHRL